MAQYRKRPVVVEAEQWFPGKAIDGIEEQTVAHEHMGTTRQLGHFVTIHGQSTYVGPGDWVIREADGVHWYPCTPEQFDRIYEAVEE